MVHRHTYNTDQIKNEISKLWKKDPSVGILVKGTAHKEFIQWIKENYSEAKEVDGWYVLKK